MKTWAHTLLLLAVIGLAGCANQPPTAAGTPFRVMTYNIHHGAGLDGKVDLERIARLIQSEGADLVALQEVDQGMARTARRDFPAELARLTGFTCVFSNNHTVQGGNYGNAVLSRFPVKRWTNLHYQQSRPGEQRGLLQLELEVQGRKLLFLNTHLDHRPDDVDRWSSVEEIEAVARQHQGVSILLCGDFNDAPGSRVYERIHRTFDDAWALSGDGDGFTVPAEAPRQRIDQLWISKDGALSPVRVWVVPSNASDHLPVVAEFRWRSTASTAR